MIVVDSSVWIDNLKGLDTPEVRTLRAIDNRQDEVLVGDLILLEVLQGARDQQHARNLEHELRCFSVRTMLSPDLAVRAAGNFRALRQRGITIRRTVDLIIGTFCIAGGHRLLHGDRDFDPMAAHLGLQVF